MSLENCRYRANMNEEVNVESSLEDVVGVVLERSSILVGRELNCREGFSKLWYGEWKYEGNETICINCLLIYVNDNKTEYFKVLTRLKRGCRILVQSVGIFETAERPASKLPTGSYRTGVNAAKIALTDASRWKFLYVFIDWVFDFSWEAKRLVQIMSLQDTLANLVTVSKYQYRQCLHFRNMRYTDYTIIFGTYVLNPWPCGHERPIVKVKPNSHGPSDTTVFF